MKKIIIEPKNPRDVKPEELQGLADNIRSLCPEYDIWVEEGRGYKGYALTWGECVLIWIALRASEALIDKIVKLAVDWARERFTRSGKEKRPKVIKIFGKDGYILITVVLKNATDEPEIRTALKGEMGERFRPPAKRKLFFRTIRLKIFNSKRPRVGRVN
jgi:hypothetical protein